MNILIKNLRLIFCLVFLVTLFQAESQAKVENKKEKISAKSKKTKQKPKIKIEYKETPSKYYYKTDSDKSVSLKFNAAKYGKAKNNKTQTKKKVETKKKSEVKKVEVFKPKAPANKWQELQDAQYYFLTDFDTGEVLLSRNPDVQIAPSSMTKLMTAYVVFDQVKRGRLSLNKQCMVGKSAYKKSGSSMFLNYGDIVSINELLRGLLAVSGNDASIVLAESTAGSLEDFVGLMNFKARELNLKNSHFRNPHGLNEDGHYMSIRDLATLTARIYKDFPEYSSYLGIREFTYRNITQHSRNPLIKGNYSGDEVGGKTGHTDDGGYGVAGSVRRDDRRLIAIVNKARTPKLRAAILTELLDYGFDKYKKVTLFKKDSSVTSLETWLAKKPKFEVVTDREVSFNIPKDKSKDNVIVKVKYKGPVNAPIKKGDKMATMFVEVKGYKTFEYPLFAKESVDKAGFFGRMKQISRYKTSGFLNKFSHKKS